MGGITGVSAPMKYSFSLYFRAPTYLALAALSLGALSACSAGDTTPDTSESLLLPDPTPVPEGSVLVGEFIAHVRPAEGKLTFERIKREASMPGLAPQSIDDLNIVSDGIEGSGPQNTVELVTNSVGYNADCPVTPNNNTFCGNVTLRHFYTRSLSNVFVQATSINPPTNHNSINSDPSEFGLDDTYGLWKYTNASATTPGILGRSPYNAATRDWVFADPDGASTDIYLRVVSSLRYANYTFDFGSQPFVDACAVGTSIGKVGSSTQTMPFNFTLFSSTSSTVNFNRRGMITFGSTAGTASGANVPLPDTNAPKPAIFVFWDDITYNTAGQLCYAVTGSEPNRKFVITWKDMTFAPTADRPSSLTFSAFLSEGSSQIDVAYDTLDGVNDRPYGNSATVGVQNETGTVSAGVANEIFFFPGDSYRFIPNPL